LNHYLLCHFQKHNRFHQGGQNLVLNTVQTSFDILRIKRAVFNEPWMEKEIAGLLCSFRDFELSLRVIPDPVFLYIFYFTNRQ